MKQFSPSMTDQDYRVLIDHLQDGIFVIEEEKFSYINQRLADLFGYPVDELIGRPFIDFIAEEDRQKVIERHRDRLAGKKVPELYDIHIVTCKGTTICCSLNAGLSVNASGHTLAVGSVRDVTEQRAAQLELQASRDELKAIFDHLPDVLYRTDMQGLITMISPSCEESLGYAPGEMLGTPMANYYLTPEERQKVVKAITDGGGKITQVEASLRRKDGTAIWVSTSASVRLGPDGQPAYIEGVARDISDRKRMEDQLLALARTDMLTGAYNRGYFMERSEEVIKAANRYHHNSSIIMADLDHFKKINDRFGHHAGDRALKAFADVCRNEIREPDIFGRMGGEEFALMLPETSIHQAEALAERIRKATEAMLIKVDGDTTGITVSIGMASVKNDERQLESALRRADLAMYQAKKAGRNRITVSED